MVNGKLTGRVRPEFEGVLAARVGEHVPHARVREKVGQSQKGKQVSLRRQIQLLQNEHRTQLRRLGKLPLHCPGTLPQRSQHLLADPQILNENRRFETN